MDDGSCDGTASVAAAFAALDPRIRLIRQENTGVSAARNRGLSALGTPYVLFLDADDWLAPDALARLSAALDAAPDAVAAFGQHTYVRDGAEWSESAPDTSFAGRGTEAPHPIPEGRGRGWVRRRVETGGRARPGDMLERLLERNLFVNGGQLLLRTDAVRREGGFREDLSFGEDYECWVRLAALGPFMRAEGQEPVLFVRKRAGSAYESGAASEESYAAWMEAVFGSAALHARFGEPRVAVLRRRAQAENAWIVGRERVRRGAWLAGMYALARSVRRKPSLRRAAVLAMVPLLPALPKTRRGPFRPVLR